MILESRRQGAQYYLGLEDLINHLSDMYFLSNCFGWTFFNLVCNIISFQFLLLSIYSTEWCEQEPRLRLCNLKAERSDSQMFHKLPTS
jgi:hypothetical protein